MKDGIHPKYDKCVVTCACGHTLRRARRPRRFTLMSAPSATRTTRVANGSWMPVDGSNVSVDGITNPERQRQLQKQRQHQRSSSRRHRCNVPEHQDASIFDASVCRGG